MGSGVSMRLIVMLVRAVLFIATLVLTEMLLRPNTDGLSTEKKKHNNLKNKPQQGEVMIYSSLQQIDG